MKGEITKIQLSALFFLRILIGWHFLYEGIAKLLNPYWSSAAYLTDSKGIFSGLFKAIVASSNALKITDFLNVWGLIAIGFALMLGLLEKTAALSGVILLLLYYIANPPFPGYSYSSPAEGSYLIVNKILIELAALLVLFLFPTGKIVGFDAFIFKKKEGTS